MEHLSPEARLEVGLSKDEKIASIERRRWYGYSLAHNIIKALERARDYPVGPRMPGVLLVGESGNGKTTLLNRFQKLNAIYDNPSGEGKIVPVLSVQAPPSGDEGQFYNDCLNRLCAEFNRNARPVEKRSQLVDLLKVVGLRALQVDELHNIGSGTAARQQNFLMVLKYLANELNIALIVAGTEDARSIITTDKQMESRLELIRLPLWRKDEETLRLLDSIECRLPLREPSNLSDDDLADLILSLANGTLMGILNVVRTAATRAITQGSERITEEHISGKKRSAAVRRRVG